VLYLRGGSKTAVEGVTRYGAEKTQTATAKDGVGAENLLSSWRVKKAMVYSFLRSLGGSCPEVLVGGQDRQTRAELEIFFHV